MNVNQIIISLVVMLCSVMGYAAEVKTVTSESVTTAKLPKKLKKILDTNIHTIESCQDMLFDDSVHMPKWLPGWVVKASNVCLTRLTGASKFIEAKKKLNLSDIEIPTKCGYKSPQGNYFVIAQYVQDSKQDLTLHDVKQVLKIAYEAGWKDAHRGNFFKTTQGTVAIIDTEAEHLEKNKKNNSKEAIASKMLCMPGYTKEAFNYLLAKNLKLIEIEAGCSVTNKKK